MLKVCTAKHLHTNQRAVGSPNKYWKPYDIITISFIGGTPSQHEFVKFWASQWLEVIGLKFNWVQSGIVRIGFQNSGSWSYIGTDCKSIPLNEQTMNFGWIDEDIRSNDGSTVLHEFGHMLGLNHEHQNPDGGIKWNKPVVVKALSGPPNYWSLPIIQANIFDTIGGVTQYTKFDPSSIMLYYFPKEWTLDGFQSKPNTVISKVDAEFLSRVYPKTVTPVIKQIDLKKVFLKESELYYLSIPVLQRLANEFGIDFTGKTKKQIIQSIFKVF